MSLEEAQEIAKEELRNRGYKVDDMNIRADEKNTAWEKKISKDPKVIQRKIVKRLNLEDKQYRAIYFEPKSKGKGGDAWVFVDSDNGEIIGVILGE